VNVNTRQDSTTKEAIYYCTFFLAKDGYIANLFQYSKLFAKQALMQSLSAFARLLSLN